MFNVIVFSDTHGNKKAVEKLAPIIRESNLTIFLGDGANDISQFLLLPKNQFCFVPGNCDGISPERDGKTIECEGKRFFICHGHGYGVKEQLLSLKLKAQSERADYAFFGHTHAPYFAVSDGLTMINPGSLGSGSTYYYMSLNSKGDFVGTAVSLRL